MTSGILYIVATPIGNLKDITLRALEILKQVDLIAAEDTRHSKHLLQHYGIPTPLFALHEHNEKQAAQQLIKQLMVGKSIAYISDAGTPLISDPGQLLVAAAHNAAVKVVPIPGACAAIAALSSAGVATDKFIFAGFLPTKMGPRKSELQTLLSELERARTLIFYEAPHRIEQFLQELKEYLGTEKQIVLTKELTKTFETIKAGSIAVVEQWLQLKPEHSKGEFVILIPGAAEPVTDAVAEETQALKITQLLAAELPPKKAAELAAKITGVNKNKCYKLLLQHSSKQ